jgi:hypothetical protein
MRHAARTAPGGRVREPPPRRRLSRALDVVFQFRGRRRLAPLAGPDTQSGLGIRNGRYSGKIGMLAFLLGNCVQTKPGDQNGEWINRHVQPCR